MKTILRTFQIFSFAELNEAAKQKAKDKHAAACGFAWATESLGSLRALAEHFNGKLTNYSVDFFDDSPSSATFDMPEMEKEEIAAYLSRLGDYNEETLEGHGDCKLTGYCGDEDAIDGFRKAFIREGQTDLNLLMKAAFRTWLLQCHADCREEYKDENFGENCDGNDYQFLADGSLYVKQPADQEQ